MSLVALSHGFQKQSTPVAVAPAPTVAAEPEIDVTLITCEATAEQLLAKHDPFPFCFPLAGNGLGFSSPRFWMTVRPPSRVS
jgi:hypothetical protein